MPVVSFDYIEKHEQMATEITTLRAENARMWAENERMRKFIEWVAETFKGRSLENDARAALEERT